MTTKIRRRITKAYSQRFVQNLKRVKESTVKIEDQAVAPLYRDAVNKYFQDGSWSYEHQTDGFFIDENLLFSMRILLETKYDLDLRTVRDRARVIIQCIYYMHRYKQAGHHQPTVIFGGDRDQMFAVYAPPLLKYLEKEYEWGVAPSEAWRVNTELMGELETDPSLTTFVYDIGDKSFDLNDVMGAIDALAQNDGKYDRIKINAKNIRVVYDEFLRMITLNKHQSKLDTRDAVHLFIASIIGTNDVWIDQRKKNTLHLGTTPIKIETAAYEAFFSRYEKTYTDAEIANINAMYDTLIEETQRRFSGDYWTPTIWADEAHRMLDSALGEGWRAKYVVWDASCGTKNLTRDYTDFLELYTSTLFQQELDTATMYNSDMISFQYDFLNDDIDITPDARLFDEWKMPNSLFKALVTDRPIVFLMNPPYGTATNDDETSKTGIAKNRINEKMKDARLGKAAQQLYAQFFYRALKIKRDFGLTNVVLAYFTKERMLCGGETWAAFMKDFQKDFKYNSGLYFNAGEFADVSASWGVSFTIWTSTPDNLSDPADSFTLQLAESTPTGVKYFGEVTKHPVLQSEFLSTWAKAPLKSSEFEKEPNQPEGKFVRLSGPLKVSSVKRANLVSGALGYMHNNANDVGHSAKEVGIYSTAFGSGNGFSVMARNFDRSVVTFGARKSLIPELAEHWITDHDNFKAPAPELLDTPEWSAFVSDCAVYAISSRSGSNQSAMRQVPYEGALLPVFNEWFWGSKSSVQVLADKYDFRLLSNDLKTHGSAERYMCNWLSGRDLPSASKSMLMALNRLLEETFPHRQEYHLDDPSLHLNSWDSGFRQLYNLAKCSDLNSVLDQYQDAFKELEDSIASRTTRFDLL